MRFEKQELIDLSLSAIVLALAFSRFSVEMFLPMLTVIVFAFIFHELAHKGLAQHYGCEASYKKWNFGLLMALFFALIGGMIFAAPGAVYISPYNRKRFAFSVNRIGKKEYGIISLGGPLTNIIIGFIFLGLSFYYGYFIFALISRISFFLALFNLLPIPPLDGFKIFRWDRRIWLITLITAIAGYIVYTML